MPLKTVTMHHPEVERPAEAPESSVHIHRRSGWITAAELSAPARKSPTAQSTKKKEGK